MIEDKALSTRITQIEAYIKSGDSDEYYKAVLLAQTVLEDTMGGRRSLMEALSSTVKNFDSDKMKAACGILVDLYRQGALRSPALRIAQELEGEVLAVASAQAKSAENAPDVDSRQMRLAVAAFMAGAALEDALRRLCDRNGISYDPRKTTLAKLQTGLYSPSQGIEFISPGENKQITSWGDTRNKADHGHFAELGLVEVATMVAGVSDFISRALSGCRLTSRCSSQGRRREIV